MNTTPNNFHEEEETGKVIRITIDHREYRFKLNTDEEAFHLRQLAGQLEKRIQNNRRSIVSTDYSKVLLVTCLDLLEEVNQNRRQEPEEKGKVDLELLKKLDSIRSLLKRNHDLP